MSRRKQSNPKPLKRKTEEGLEEIADLLHLPTELFSVRDPEDDIHEYTLFTKRPMRQGTSFGPYNGHVTDRDKDSNLHVIKTKGKHGETVHFTLLDEIGGWLKLLRPASSCDTCNASLLHNDSVIWCTISADLEPDTELVVNRVFAGSASPPTPQLDSPLRSRSKRLLRRSPPEDDVKEEEIAIKRESGIFHPDRVVHLTEEKKSPFSEDHGRIFNGRLLSEDAVKYEVSSPTSPPSSATSPSRSTTKGVPGEAVASDEAAIPYINGYHYPPAFPYGGVLSAIDGSFKCEACDVFFNNRRNLDVHQTYYCQGKTSSGALAGSDTEAEDTVNQKSDRAIMGSPSASDDGEAPTLKDHLSSKGPHPEVMPSEDSQTHSKRRRATSLNDLPPAATKHARVFKCPYCSYSSDKKASLTRHIRMHGSSPGADGHNEIPLPTPPMARYCANCDIQFASFKNYQVHKEFYCNTRHVHKSTNASSSPNQTHQHSQAQQKPQVGAVLPVPAQTSQSPDAALQQQSETAASNKNYNVVLNHQPLYAAISTSPLILVPCSYVAGGGLSPGLVPAGNIVIPPSSPEAANDSPNVIPTYTVLPGASGELSSSSPPAPVGEESLPKDDSKPPIAKSSNAKIPKREPSRSPEEALNKEDIEKPLDLSFRKRDSECHSSKKAKVDGGAIINSFTSGTSSSSEDSAMPQTPAPLMPVLTSPLDMNNVISRGSGLETLAPPPVIVKQGTSKCQECNIVFYKHENYLVHKNRYCAARVQKREISSPEKGRVDEEDNASSSAKEESGRTSQKSPIASPRISNSRSPPIPEHSSDSGEASPSHIPQSMLQYYCMACGIKYTSVDNLRAHQLYYCLKRDTSSTPMTLVPSFPSRATASSQEFRCGKCKNAYPTEDLLRQHPCVVQRKCPYCDVYCPTLSAAQRHLVSHTGIKSFRCSLCGYKGHTLRGMRTHIRIHLDKNSSTPEEAYIVCMDEGGTEIGCAGRKTSSSTRSLNSDRIKSVIATEPPLHSEATLMVNPLPTVAPMDVVAIKAVTEDPVATGDTTHWCQICGYSSSYKGNVVRHVKLVHKDLVTNQAMSSVVNSRPSVETVPKVTEPVPVEHSSNQSASQDHISIAEHSNSSSSSMDVKPIVNGMLGKNEIQRLDISNKSPPLMKTENISPPPTSMNSKGIKRSLPEESQCSGTFSSSKVGPKYCKSCDISFNYLSNFLAHKKFYCTPRPGEVAGQESSSVQSVQ